MYSGLIHRNILRLFELFEEFLSIWSCPKKYILWNSGFISDITRGASYNIEEPTASHSILSNHQGMTEMKSYAESRIAAETISIRRFDLSTPLHRGKPEESQFGLRPASSSNAGGLKSGE
jgi:hypothetical protein